MLCQIFSLPLEGTDDETRDVIPASIQKIGPQVAVPKVELQTYMAGVIQAESVFATRPATSQDKSLNSSLIKATQILKPSFTLQNFNRLSSRSHKSEWESQR